MKVKVIIENGETEIRLMPENVFEKDVVEKVYDNKGKFNINTSVDAKYNYGSYSDHKIVISLKETR